MRKSGTVPFSCEIQADGHHTRTNGACQSRHDGETGNNQPQDGIDETISKNSHSPEKIGKGKNEDNAGKKRARKGFKALLCQHTGIDDKEKRYDEIGRAHV